MFARLSSPNPFPAGLALRDAANAVRYDARGRDYRDETFAVDPETGAVGASLVGERWRDASGNVIKESGRLAGAAIDSAQRNPEGGDAVGRRRHQTRPGVRGFVKRLFDAFGQETHSWRAGNPAGGSDDGDPAEDIVVEQR